MNISECIQSANKEILMGDSLTLTMRQRKMPWSTNSCNLFLWSSDMESFLWRRCSETHDPRFTSSPPGNVSLHLAGTLQVPVRLPYSTNTLYMKSQLRTWYPPRISHSSLPSSTSRCSRASLSLVSRLPVVPFLQVRCHFNHFPIFNSSPLWRIQTVSRGQLQVPCWRPYSSSASQFRFHKTSFRVKSAENHCCFNTAMFS